MDEPQLHVPPGFCVRRYSGPQAYVAAPRVMRFSPSGDLFVAAPLVSTPGGSNGGQGAIVVLPDDDHDGRADTALPYLGGGASSSSLACNQHDADPNDLACVHGLAFTDTHIYFTRRDDVRRIPWKAGDRVAPAGASELVATLGTKPSARFTHTLDVSSTSGALYVSRGRFDAGLCDDSGAEGAVLSLDLGAPMPVTPAVVAQGFRNPLYLRCHPESGTCFANELSGDTWSGIGGREKLVPIASGQDWGYPCCVAKGLPVPPQVGGCDGISAEMVSILLHDTPFGLDFERGNFPPAFRGAAFIALHGAFPSWDGTRLVAVAVDPASKSPVGPISDFATGWGRGPGGIIGRATDVAFAPDGRLFVLDDQSGGIWWIAPVDLKLPAGW